MKKEIRKAISVILDALHKHAQRYDEVIVVKNRKKYQGGPSQRYKAIKVKKGRYLSTTDPKRS